MLAAEGILVAHNGGVEASVVPQQATFSMPSNCVQTATPIDCVSEAGALSREELEDLLEAYDAGLAVSWLAALTALVARRILGELR